MARCDGLAVALAAQAEAEHGPTRGEWDHAKATCRPGPPADADDRADWIDAGWDE